MNIFKQLEKPIILVIGFNLFTLVVFMTAPVAWATDNLILLCLFVLACQLSILIGFQRGRNRGLLVPERTLPFSSGEWLTNTLFVIYTCTFLISYAYRMGYSALDVAGMYNLLLAGVRDRRFGYEMSLRGTGIGPLPWTVYFITSVFNQIFFIVGFLQWKQLKTVKRLLFVCFTCIELFFWVGRGSAFGVVCLVTTFYLSSMFWTNSIRIAIAKVFKRPILLGVLFAGSVAFFSYNLYSRSGDVERGFQLAEFWNSPLISNHAAFEIVPESLIPTYLNVVSYVAGGYYHTSLAFDLDFKSTWGLGSNPALMDLASVFGIDVWGDTYIHRLQSKGIDEYRLWHTAYTWYASDVSYYGVPFMMYVLGYMFGFSWVKGGRGDFISKIVFIIIGNMLFYLFANNTYLSTVFYSFIVLMPVWCVTRLFGWLRAAAGHFSSYAIPGS